MSKPAKQTVLHHQLPVGSKARAKLSSTLTPRTRHGGRQSLKKRKTIRPFATNVPIHLVLKSKRAKGIWSLLHRRNKGRIRVGIYTYAERFKIHVYRSAIVHNHVHLLVKAHDRKNLADFLRVFAGRTAVIVTGAYKGVKKIGKFWDYLTWSRLVNYGADFYNVRKYVLANEVEEFSRSHRELIRTSTMIEQWDEIPPDIDAAFA